MSDFISAIKAGIDSAKDADLAIREINNVLNELDSSVRAASGGQLCVKLYHNALASMANLARGVDINQMYDISIAHVADDTKKKHTIASFSRASDGYPVALAAGGVSMTASDAAGLRSALAKIMSNPATGRLFLGFGNEIKPPQTVASKGSQSNVLKRSRPK